MNFGQYPFWLYSGSSFGCQAPLYPNMQMQNCTVEQSAKEFEKQLKDRAERINKEKIERMQRQIEELESLVAQQKQNQVLIDALKPTPYPNYVGCGEDPREVFEKEMHADDLKDFEEVYGRKEKTNNLGLWVLAIELFIFFTFIFFKIRIFDHQINKFISLIGLIITLSILAVKPTKSKK